MYQNVRKIHLGLAIRCEGGGAGGRGVEKPERSTSNSRSDAREVVAVAQASKHPKKIHLWLAFGCEGGGGSGKHVENIQLQLAFGCEGGDGGVNVGVTGVSGGLKKKK